MVSIKIILFRQMGILSWTYMPVCFNCRGSDRLLCRYVLVHVPYHSLHHVLVHWNKARVYSSIDFQIIQSKLLCIYFIPNSSHPNQQERPDYFYESWFVGSHIHCVFNDFYCLCWVQIIVKHTVQHCGLRECRYN